MLEVTAPAGTDLPEGLVAVGYERAHGAYSRIDQFARVHLFNPSTDVYSCPLAMTDGAAKTLLSHPKTAVTEAAVARLTSRDPARMWTSGQWMTERTGGSDVSRTETVARRDGDGWRLYGTKWFSSATTSESPTSYTFVASLSIKYRSCDTKTTVPV